MCVWGGLSQPTQPTQAHTQTGNKNTPQNRCVLLDDGGVTGEVSVSGAGANFCSLCPPRCMLAQARLPVCPCLRPSPNRLHS